MGETLVQHKRINQNSPASMSKINFAMFRASQKSSHGNHYTLTGGKRAPQQHPSNKHAQTAPSLTRKLVADSGRGAAVPPSEFTQRKRADCLVTGHRGAPPASPYQTTRPPGYWSTLRYSPATSRVRADEASASRSWVVLRRRRYKWSMFAAQPNHTHGASPCGAMPAETSAVPLSLLPQIRTTLHSRLVAAPRRGTCRWFARVAGVVARATRR